VSSPAPTPTPRWLAPLAFGLFVAAFLAVGAYLRQVPAADAFPSREVEFSLWVTVMGLLGGLALASAAYLVWWLPGLARLSSDVTAADRLLWAGVVVVVLGTVLAVLFVGGSAGPDSVDRSLASQTRPVIVACALCLAPGLIGLLAVRSVARGDSGWQGSDAERLQLLLRLRSELRRLLTVLGAFLTLLVVATGARRQAMLTLRPAPDVPAEVVVLYGGTFAVVLGLFFVVANGAIDARAGELLEQYAALPDLADPALSQQIARRDDLAGLLGLGGSRRTFESSVVVASPLLTALVAAALGS